MVDFVVMHYKFEIKKPLDCARGDNIDYCQNIYQKYNQKSFNAILSVGFDFNHKMYKV